MKSLFADYFNISLACTFLILAIIILRILIRKAPKSMTCVLWTLVFVRLVLPFRLESFLSIRPPLPIVNEDSTGFFFEAPLVPENTIPEFLPRSRAAFSFGDWSARIDYVQLAAWVWFAVFAFLLLYMIGSYLLLLYRLRESVRVGDRVYKSEKLTGGFLIGYLRPRIYLPARLEPETEATVIAHEKAHRKRGDHWLKLFAFLCLCLHWYNPFVWIAYILLCNDIEYACDESVIRNMTEDERKKYSSALLSVGRRYGRIRVCPLPFGESSIRKRIYTVLSYRKPAIWISMVAMIAILFSAVFLVPDPIPEYPPYYNRLIGLVGQSKEAVTQELDIELIENEYSSTTGYYETPLCVEYRGVEFNVILGFSLVDDKLWGFQYAAIYEDNVQQAAADTVKIAKQLQRTYGRAKQNANKRTLWLSDIDVEAVLQKFENRHLAHEGIDQVYGYWELTEELGSETQAYWEQLTTSEQWQTYWEDRRVDLSFRLDFSAWNDPHSNKSYLCMDFDTAYHFLPRTQIIN